MKTFSVFKLIELQTTAEATGSPWLSSRETDSCPKDGSKNRGALSVGEVNVFQLSFYFTFKSLVLSKSAYWWMYDELSAAWGLAQASWPNPLYSCCSAKRSVEVLRNSSKWGRLGSIQQRVVTGPFSIRNLYSGWVH